MFVSVIAVCGALLVSGCALPPVIAIASYASTGISYLTSGKGPTDHALSAMADRDCAMHRMVTGGNICLEQGDQPADGPDGGVVIASADSPDQKGVRLDGIVQGTEIFALIQDDGALEIFAHDPALIQAPENLQLILKVDGYRNDSASVDGVRMNGKFYAISDILV